MKYDENYVRFFSKEDQEIISDTIMVQNPLICSHCKNTGPQKEIETIGTLGDYDQYKVISITACSLCGSNSIHYCFHVIDSDSNYSGSEKKIQKFNIGVSYPKSIDNKEIPEEISKRYKRFVNVYTQSQQAEKEDLDELAGMGYRKAIEILITDYLLEYTPQNVDKEWLTNPKTRLGQKIEKLPSKRLERISKSISYLGNDETHYTRIHEDEDIQSLKAFVKVLISEIDHELIFNKSESFLNKIFPKKKDSNSQQNPESSSEQE